MALLDAQGFGVCCPLGSQVVISISPGEKKPTGWWAVCGLNHWALGHLVALAVCIYGDYIDENPNGGNDKANQNPTKNQCA